MDMYGLSLRVQSGLERGTSNQCRQSSSANSLITESENALTSPDSVEITNELLEFESKDVTVVVGKTS